tara:strand:+ start:2642 stop:2956 length:315 start_codon:yes stop_codon:yes gene_type:complete
MARKSTAHTTIDLEKSGRIHDLAHRWRAPELLRYAIDGMVYGLRQPGRVVTGNCCAVLADSIWTACNLNLRLCCRHHCGNVLENGAGEAIRTPDPNLGKVVLYP